MMHNLILLIIFIIVFAILITNNNKETFAPGLYNQLYAKDVQDLNLTTDTDKYLQPYDTDYYYHPNYYTYFWNAPTRWPRAYPYPWYYRNWFGRWLY